MAQIPPDSPVTTESNDAPEARPLKRTRRGKWYWRIARSLTFIYIGVSVGLGCLQDKLIFPGAASQGQKTSIVSPSPKFELIELKTATGEKTFAVFATAQDQFRNALPDAATRPTLIFFYGNGEYLACVLGDVTYFRQMGVNILAVEYLGYGMAEGRPGEKQFYASADAAYAHLVARTDVDRNKLIAVGRSIGCAPAIDLAARHKFIGVICFSPFTSLTAMGRHVMPFLPTSLILRHKFDNLSKIKTIDAPIFISHGKLDRIVPFFMSEQLRAAAKGEVTFVPIDDGDHNDLMDAGGEDLDTALRKFIERCATR